MSAFTFPEGYTFPADLIPCAHCRRQAKGRTLTARCNGVLYCSDCDPGPMIRLQAIGWQRAVPAAELKPGDVLLWNFGSRTMVHRIEQRGQWLHFTLCSANRDSTWGDTHERKMAPHRLVAKEA